MKPLNPPSERFDKSLRSTSHELDINGKDFRTNHFVQVAVTASSIDDECSLSLPSLSIVVNNEATSVQTPNKTQTNVPKGLYSYGSPDLNASAFLQTESTSLSELVYDKRKQKMSPKTKTKNSLRSPVIDSGALHFPVQRPPPPQPIGPVPVPSTQRALGSKSTGSLLGPSSSFHSMNGMFYGSSSALLGNTSLASPSRPVLVRPRLSAVDLLRDVGEELDSDLRARTVMCEPAEERFGFTSGQCSARGWRDQHQHRNSSPNTRPSSPALQVVDVNQMVQLDAPPTPSNNQHQQDLALHMKLAYLSIPTAGVDDQRTLSSKSRPGSRAAPKTPVSLSTQILRLPSAGAQELSAHTELSGEMNPASSAGSLPKNHMEQESFAELKMGSEIETSIVSSALKTPSTAVSRKPTVTMKKTKVAATTAKPPPQQQEHLAQSGTGTIGASRMETGSPERVNAPEASISPGLLHQLPAEQIRALQQPHYRDPRFQNNPQEVVYRLRGHLLNTTPYPEEIAHLTLHGKSQPLPQYLRVQLEEQQQRYAHKVHVLGGQQGHARSDILAHSSVGRARSPEPELKSDTAPGSDGRAVEPQVSASPLVLDGGLSTAKEEEGADAQQQPESSEKSAPLRSLSLTQPPTPVLVPEDASSHKVATAVAVAAVIAEAPGSSLPSSVGDASVLFSDDIESRVGTARSTLSKEQVAAQQLSEITPGQPSTTDVRSPTVPTTAAGIVMDDEESVSSFQETQQQQAPNHHTRTAQDDNHSIVSAVSAASTARSHASSADGTNHRSLSIRISSTGNMYEVGSRNTRADSPLDPLIIRVGSHDSQDLSEPNAAAAGGMTLPSGRSSPAAPVLAVPDFLQPSPAPQFRQQHVLTTEGLVIQGRSSPGRRMSGQHSRQRHSPNRVAYVLNDGSDRPQVAVLQTLDQPSAAPGGDDRSLHSLQSSVGNCSAITDDANLSMLSFTLPASPLPAQSPLNSGKLRKHNLNGSSSSLRTSSKFAPRLESIRGGDSVSSTVGPSAQPLPYQVHRKIMGWKLTSVQRRRNLVGILDLVHNSQQQQQRLQAQQQRAHRRSGSKSTIPGKLAPPKQIPHALLRTGHGQRVRSREIPPLPELTTQLASIQEQQQSLQHSQVTWGFERSAELQHWQQQMYMLQHAQNDSSINSHTAPLKSTKKNKKSNAHNPLTASNSKLANLAIAVETMGKFLSEENEAADIKGGGQSDRVESEATT